jgi:hypothetical protein
MNYRFVCAGLGLAAALLAAGCTACHHGCSTPVPPPRVAAAPCCPAPTPPCCGDQPGGPVPTQTFSGAPGFVPGGVH